MLYQRSWAFSHPSCTSCSEIFALRMEGMWILLWFDGWTVTAFSAWINNAGQIHALSNSIRMNVLTPEIKVVGGWVCTRAVHYGGICLPERCEIQRNFMAVGRETVWFIKNELDIQFLRSALFETVLEKCRYLCFFLAFFFLQKYINFILETTKEQ